MRKVWAVLCFLIVNTLISIPVGADPRAVLSWRSGSTSADTTVVDKEAPLRLYVRLENVPGVRAATINLAWVSQLFNHRAYSAYDVATSSGSSCTWLWPAQPQTIQQLGDSTVYVATTGSTAASCSTGRAWYIDFISSDTTDVRSTFSIAQLRCLLSDGTTIFIDSTTTATVNGGASTPSPSLGALWPPQAWIGLENKLILTGAGFTSSMDMLISKPGLDTLEASHELLDKYHLQITTTPGEADTGRWSIDVGVPGGPASRYALPLSIHPRSNSSLQLRAGDGSSSLKLLIVVRSGSLPLTGPRPVPVELLPQSEAISALASQGVRRVRCLWPELTPQATSTRTRSGVLVPLTDFGNYFEMYFDNAVEIDLVKSRLERLEWVTAVQEVPGAKPLSCPFPVNWNCTNVLPPNDAEFPFIPCSTPPCYQLGQWALWQSDAYTPSGVSNSELDFGYDGRVHEDIDATCAWDYWYQSVGSRAVTVAFIDTGIDTLHPDLQHTYSVGGKKIRSGLNVSGDAYAADNVFDHNGHGTRVASVAAAITNNGTSIIRSTPMGTLNQGMAGVAGGWWTATQPDSVGCRILPVKAIAFDPYTPCIMPETDASIVACGINWAAAQGAQVINISLGSKLTLLKNFYHSDYKVLRDAIFNAIALGATCITAMGDEDDESAFAPARYSEWGLVTAVGASDLCGQRVGEGFTNSAHTLFDGEGSSYGAWQDVLAPGYQLQVANPTQGESVDYFCSEPGFGVERFGTSFSAGFVSGIAASLISIQPALHDTDIRQILRMTAMEKNLWGYGRGAGRVSLLEAVKLVAPKGPSAQQLYTGTTSSAQRDSVASNIQLDVRTSDGLIADGVYNVDRHALTFRVPLPTTFLEPPVFWPHIIGTRGWTAESPHFFNYNAAQIIGQDADSLTFRTYVYKVLSTGQWLPCPPESAMVAYHGLGRPASTTAVQQTSTGSLLQVRLIGSPMLNGGAIRCHLKGIGRQSVQIRVLTVAGRVLRRALLPLDEVGEALWSWDGKTDNGSRCQPGVYFISLSDADGRLAGAGKVVIVN